MSDQSSEANDSGYYLVLDGVEKLETADQWIAWLEGKKAWVDLITDEMRSGPLPELKIVAMWASYEQLARTFDHWVQTQPDGGIDAAGQAFVDLKFAVYLAISPFIVESWGGLTLKLLITAESTDGPELSKADLARIIQNLSSAALAVLGREEGFDDTTNALFNFIGTRH